MTEECGCSDCGTIRREFELLKAKHGRLREQVRNRESAQNKMRRKWERALRLDMPLCDNCTKRATVRVTNANRRWHSIHFCLEHATEFFRYRIAAESAS